MVRHPGRDQLHGLVVLTSFDMGLRGEPQLPGRRAECLVARTPDRKDGGFRLLRNRVAPDRGVTDEDQGALGSIHFLASEREGRMTGGDVVKLLVPAAALVVILDQLVTGVRSRV